LIKRKYKTIGLPYNASVGCFIGGIGYYTATCDKPCPQKCPSGSCHRVQGYCECPAGLYGPSCNLPCLANSWGPNCINSCLCHPDHSSGCDAKVC